jgi:glycosyltransferase involved in cell wall biosynthesis
VSKPLPSSRLRVALLVAGRVPARKYGGTERVVPWLARELVRQGHAVTVIASDGSDVPGARMIFARSREEASARIPSDVDLVHYHSWFEPGGKLPSLNTLHGNAAGPIGPGNWSFVSRNHAERHGRKTFVYNGLPVEEHYFSAVKSPRYLFLAGISRAGKNVTKAIKLAHDFDLELDIAGGNRWKLLTRTAVRREGAFFLSLDRRFRFHGMVGGWEKAKLFADARAFLYPIRWEEPFGLVIVESLLAGTPVIATPRGAMPEIVHPEVGFLASSDEEFGAAFEGVGHINPSRCREYAAESFRIEKTAAQYVELYRRVLDGETLT